MLTLDLLKERFSYKPDTGQFIRKTNIGRKRIGTVAGSKNSDGYVLIEINKRSYRAHRLAWFYVYGKWPKHTIDHINGNRSDNRISNLRDVPRSVNVQNQRKASSNNRSGYLGVRVRRNRFYASIRHGGREVSLGGYATAKEAHQAYLEAKRDLHQGCTI